MSVACTRISDEPLSSSLLGNEKNNVFKNNFNKPDGTSFNQIANEPRMVTPAVLEDIDHVPTGFPISKPQRQDEAYAALSHPERNELRCSTVTHGKELLRHPVVGQLAMIGTWLAIREAGSEQPPVARLPSNLRRAASPNSGTLGGLKSEITKWRRRRAGGARSVDNMEYSTFTHDSEPTPQEVQTKTISFTFLMTALSRGESLRLTEEQSSKTSGRTENVWQTRTAGPKKNLQNSFDPPERRQRDPALRPAETSCCGRRDAPATSHLTISTDVAVVHTSLTESSTRCWSLDYVSGYSSVAVSHQLNTTKDPHLLRPSINSLTERVAVEDVRVLAKASTTVSRIPYSINLMSSSWASTTLFRSLLLTTYIRPLYPGRNDTTGSGPGDGLRRPTRLGHGATPALSGDTRLLILVASFLYQYLCVWCVCVALRRRTLPVVRGVSWKL